MPETRQRGTGAAPLRHVGLVALEALLIAVLVWVAAMTLAGTTGADGITGAAIAGRAGATLSLVSTGPAGTITIAAKPGETGMWVHLTCAAAAGEPVSQWARIGTERRVTFDLARSPAWTPAARSCAAEEGYFSTKGRWRVLAATTFSLGA
jgi:hypothetical protein